MTYTGTGTRSEPISLYDSEEDVIQELSYQQYCNGISSSIQKLSTVQGKRKRVHEEAEIPIAGPSNPASLENRLSQPESKNARKRRRRAERLALEQQQQRVRDVDWLSPASDDLPGSRRALPSLGTRLCSETPILEYGIPDDVQHLDFHEDVRRTPQPSKFGSEWVTSMALAGEAMQDDHVVVEEARQSSPKLPPPPTPVLPAPLPPPAPPPPPPAPPLPEILPPIHIHPDLAMSFETTTTTTTQTAVPNLLPPIGMIPEQDPNSQHGIFRITQSTKQAGVGTLRNLPRKAPYIPNPARTLVMEQLPKTHRTIGFVDRWCRSTSGCPPLHVFVDYPSAKALIEFGTAELARRAWSSPRLGRDLHALKSHQLRGRAREDLIKVWWYRVNGVGAGGGVGEIEEGEIEGDSGAEKEVQPPPPPHAPPADGAVAAATPSEAPPKESKRERKQKLAKRREQKKLKVNSQQQQQQQKEVVGAMQTITSTPLNPLAVQTPTLSQLTFEELLAQALPAFMPPTIYPFNPSLPSLNLAPSWQFPWETQSIPQQQAHYSGCQLGATLPSTSSNGPSNSFPTSDPAFASSSSSSKMVLASTAGQADDCDEHEMDMDVDGASSVGPQASLSSTTTATSAHHPVAPPTYPQANFCRDPPISGPGRKRKRTRTKRQGAAAVRGSAGQAPPNGAQPLNHRQTWQPEEVRDSNAMDGPSPVFPLTTTRLSNAAQQSPHNIANAAVRNKVEERLAKNKLELAAAAAATLSSAQNNNDGNAAIPPKPREEQETVPPKSVAPATTTTATVDAPSSSEVSTRAIEENLRHLVFASKNRIRNAAAPSGSGSMDCDQTLITRTIPDAPRAHSELGVDLRAQSRDADSAKTPESESCPQARSRDAASANPPASESCPHPSTVMSGAVLDADSFSSFEDLAVTFITQTIETIKAAAAPRSGQSGESSSSSSSSSSSTTPSPIAQNSSSIKTSQVRTELAIKQKRLEDHIQETKTLMDRISTAKTKSEKDLLFKIMREKTRLFEEEQKASEKRLAKANANANVEPDGTVKEKRTEIRSRMTLRFQQWPTAEYSAVLVLSDDED